MRERTLVQRDDGFTLVEVLVVVVLLSILVMIAVPVYISQRERAWDATTQSDLRNAKVALETYYSVHGSYEPVALVPSQHGFIPSPDVNLDDSNVIGGTTYCLSGRYGTTGNWYSIDDGGGAVVGPADSNPC